MTGVPVLMYHAIEDEAHPAGARDPGEQVYVLAADRFREQMEFLYRNGFKTLLLGDLRSGRELPEKRVVLTFDDGHQSNYSLALPILQQFGFRGVFFLTTGWLGLPHFLSAHQVRALHDAGMELGTHGASHSFFTDLEPAALERELGESRALLAAMVGREVTCMSAPGGRVDAKVEGVARGIGYDLICSSVPGLADPGARGAIPRFAVRNSCSMAEFAAIVNTDQRLLRRIALRAGALDTAKRVLGNRAYDQIRALLLRN